MTVEANSNPAQALRGNAERVVAAIWSDLLSAGRLDRHAHFFQLGGDSLLGVQVMLRIKELLHVEIPLTVLFEHPTVNELAYAIVERQIALLAEDDAELDTEGGAAAVA